MGEIHHTIDTIRKEYTRGSLHRKELPADPFRLFDSWLREAVTAGVPEPTAMALSTIGENGMPQSRILLLKSFDPRGFIFYTNFRSAKGMAISTNSNVALLFFWPELQRQVRITGTASPITPEESAAYFKSRPHNSRVGAWASDQSAVIASRSALEERCSEYEKLFRGKEIPVPPNWGGFRVTPLEMEFWQGRENRLHDRFLFSGTNNQWSLSRLAP